MPPVQKTVTWFGRDDARTKFQFDIYLQSAVRWPSGRRRRFANVAQDHRTGLRFTISGPFFIGVVVGVGCRLTGLGPRLGTLLGTLLATPVCA